MASRSAGRPAPRQTITLRLGIARLRFGSWVAAKRLRRLQIKTGAVQRPLRRWFYVAALASCLAAAVTGTVVSILAQGKPMLYTFDNQLPGADEVIVLDPDRRDEAQLSPGYLYDRPVAAVQTGAAPVLLRMRLEETLLTASRDGGGRVTVFKPMREPGEIWSPRTITQDAALQQLRGGGLCKPGDSWEDALGLKLPARRLPGGDNDGGRLLVFEKKTIIADPDSPIPDDLVGVLLPEDIEEYGLGMIIYTYTGFYYIKQGSGAVYQPLRIEVDDISPRRPTQRPPSIIGISYAFYQWEVTQSQVHKYGEDLPAPVDLQLGELRPLDAWQGPEDAWFYDPTDGWVYYGQALAPGAMTPLLLRSYAVWPDSPLLQDETRYRLSVRAQSAPQDYRAVLRLWNSDATLGNLGRCNMTQEAANALFGRAYPPEAGVINYVYEDDEE